jgi:cytochrome c peroxidase
LAFAAGSAFTFASQVETVEAKAANVDMAKVRKDLVDLIDTDAEKRGDGTSLTGTFVRLAWHCAGTYAKADNSGGSNGARMRFNKEASYGGNAGLKMARDALEPIKAANPEISYADLYTLSGIVAVENAAGPVVPFRLGREDFSDGTTSPDDGRLPNADMGAPSKTIPHVREVFNRLGFDDREMVALSGAHALGRCHTNASGYWGPWTFAENTMSNEYFRLLVEEEWTIKKTHNGKKWTGPEQYEDKTGKLMMLPSDIALIQDPEFKKVVELYAKDEDLFFKDFSAAFSKLLELGVPFPKPWWKVW